MGDEQRRSSVETGARLRYAPSKKLEGLEVVDATTGDVIGTVFDVLDPHESPGAGLAAPLLEVALDEKHHFLVPLAPECVPEVGDENVVVDAPPGLLDLAFVYEPPSRPVKGLLAAPEGDA